MNYLYDKLKEYSKEGVYPMHMPGHKRNLDLMSMDNPYAIDITEIDDFDNLHDAQEIILDNMKEAASLYHAKYTHYLINGSTAGILAAIAACTKKGDKIIVARNCHKAVYHALYLNELNPVYVYPKINEQFHICQGILASQIEQKLKLHKDCAAIIITSPTYEGVISDVEQIVNLAHTHNIPLIVDEAHGAHLGFHNQFPNNSVTLGADIVIHSVHKTLPSFTQTALIHINDKYVDYEKVKRFLSIYQTSSPSYILMAGISQCIRLIKRQGDIVFDQYYGLLREFYKEVKDLKHLLVFSPYNRDHVESFLPGYYGFDPSKIVIFTTRCKMTGKELYDILLKRYKIQCEMATCDYVIAMTSVADTEEGFARLTRALCELDKEVASNQISCHEESEKKEGLLASGKEATICCSLTEAYNRKKEEVVFDRCAGRISAEMVYVYPPGIPIIAPGELITKEVLKDLSYYYSLGLFVKGIIIKDEIYLSVLGEENG